LGYKRRLFGFIGLRRKIVVSYTRTPDSASAWADVQNPASRPGIFSSLQKKKRRRTFPNKGIYLAAAADRLWRYALLVVATKLKCPPLCKVEMSLIKRNNSTA